MNNNLDFLNKEEVNSFLYSSINEDRIKCKNVVIDGRTYTKWGKEQIITLMGIMFKARNNDTGMSSYFVTVGMSKQHPEDLHNDKKVAMETARINALTNPVIVMYDVSSTFDNYNFKRMMEAYVDTMQLDFVMTKDELRKKKEAEFNKDWEFYLKNKQ